MGYFLSVWEYIAVHHSVESGDDYEEVNQRKRMTTARNGLAACSALLCVNGGGKARLCETEVWQGRMTRRPHGFGNAPMDPIELGR